MAIAEYLNYKTASEAADVSPSLLSQQMVSLEEELGVDLFVRDKKSVRLTPAGEELKRSVPSLERALREAVSIIYRMKEEEGEMRELHVGYEDFFVRNILLAFDALLREALPGVRGLYTQYTGQELFEALTDGVIDLAFALLPAQDIPDDLTVRILRQDELVLVLPKAWEKEEGALPFSHMEEKPLCAYLYNPFGTEQIIEAHRQYGARPQVKLCESIDEMLTYVESGMGYTILPRFYVESRRNTGLTALIPMRETVYNRLCLSVVYDKEKLEELYPGAIAAMERMAKDEPACDSCQIDFCQMRMRLAANITKS